MKRAVILPAVAIILLAIYAGPYLLLLLLVIPIGYFFIDRLEKAAPKRVTYANIEEVEAKYGQADDVVVLSPTRANELQALMLFYKAQDKVIVCGEEMRLSDLEGVMAKNMATPYTIDEYAVVIATKDPQHPTIQLRVGYDGGLASEIAAEIDKHISRDS
ncbi:MAG: hypothetical protein J6Y59_02225 [Bacteroidaceae bacterium]|nr:hypothetical protein [Bacteroidaceae bacterium]